MGSRVWGGGGDVGGRVLRQGGGAAGAARQLQRIRNGQIMTALLDVFGGILVALILCGVCNLQSWLERWDQERHFED